jgi:hypothetical protein
MRPWLDNQREPVKTLSEELKTLSVLSHIEHDALMHGYKMLNC